MSSKYNFNVGWKFIKKNITDAFQSEYSDALWTDVSLPHTYNDIDTFDNFMEGGHNGERSMFTGKTWYRKHFKLADKQAGKRILIEFEGVRQAADVYINGVKLEGKSENGFIPFGYDLTDYVYFGDQENILAVMVDNSFPYYAEDTDAILSWHDSHWHPTHGGIYRNVNLYIKDPVYITLPLMSFLGTKGIYAYNLGLAKDKCQMGVEAEVINSSSTSQTIESIITVLNHQGQVVMTLSKETSIAAGEKHMIKTQGAIENPHLWSPNYPYLYSVQVDLYSEGRLLDRSSVPLGIREIEFTNSQGFFINGNHLKLKGWGQRPTNEWAGLGTAFPDWMHTYIHQLMKDAGANFIRWGHSAGAPADIKASDKLGLLAIQPGVDGEGSTIGGVYSEDSYQVRIKAFRDMVVYFRNSPSIFVWEGGNQSVPDKEAQALRTIVDEYDPYGKRVFAHRRSDVSMAKYVDLSIGTEGSWELKSKHFPIVEGEYNREEAARRVWDRSTLGYEDYHTAEGSAYDLTSEDLAKNQAKHFAKISHPAHSGGANWIFSDSTSHGRVYSEVSRVSGVVDGVMLAKEAFYACQAIYSIKPQLHIIGHWNYSAGTIKSIYVMANVSKVELLVNGQSLGFGKQSDQYLFTFDDVAFEAGEIKAIGYGDDHEVIIETVKETTGKASHIQLSTLKAKSGFKADGADILHIDVEVVDAEGRRLPTFEGRVNFDMTGPAVWRGGYNSGLEDSTNKDYLYLEAGINRVAIRSTQEAGEITIQAKIDGLPSAFITVTSLAVNQHNGLVKIEKAEYQPLINKEPAFGSGPLDQVDYEDVSDKENIVTDFSYSGINNILGISLDVNIGSQIYADREVEFAFLPSFLIGSEYLVLPNEDANYKALDLINFSVNQDADLFIAHDDSIERPLWLTADFEETEGKMMVDGHIHTIFKKYLANDSTITLGGNADELNVYEGNMYIVFVKEYDKNLIIKNPIPV